MKHSRIDFSNLSLWLTNERVDELIPYLTSSQISDAAKFKLEAKKHDFLRSRALVNFASGVICEHIPRSEEVLKHGNYFTSISHKDPYCAVLASETKSLLGVDIELLGCDRSALRKKVLSPAEMDTFAESDLPAVYAFSFKEAVFKCLNTTHSEVKYFHQCKIVSFKDSKFIAQIVTPSLISLEILGRAFHLTSSSGEYILTVAYC
jgi:phosphopantetheinyl transferase (holo-ACP synthase)